MRPSKSQLGSAVFLIIGLLTGAVFMAGALTADITRDIEPVERIDPDTIRLTTQTPARVDGPSTLVLWDPALSPGEPLRFDGEIGGIFMANLAGHFGPVTTMAVQDYEAGDGARFDGVVYVGVRPGDTGDNPLPEGLLRDVADDRIKTLWLGAGIDQLMAITTPEGFAARRGWTLAGDDGASPDVVTYMRRDLERNPEAEPIHRVEVTDERLADVLATAAEAGRAPVPYAVRSGALTYVAEVPFGFLIEGNHSVVIGDLMFDLLDPDRPSRHRAMVRLEDIGPTADPERLRVAGEALAARNVPFSLAVYPIWRDPLEQYALGVDVGLADRPELVETLRYLETIGGTILMHGVTHQADGRANPYAGTSGEDFEFYSVELDDEGRANPVGPLPEDEDSPEWFEDRIRLGLAEFESAGLDAPDIFEFPHYLGSRQAYETVSPWFRARYEQASYYPGILSGEDHPEALPRNQFFPYPVVDAYGSRVIPENLGAIIPEGDPLYLRLPADLVRDAEEALVVRDGVASFMFHPYLDLSLLTETVDGLLGLGYQFVSPETLLEEWR